MITIEQYADLCAAMADSGGDQREELDLARAHGVSATQWIEAKAHYTARMTDPADLGRTAMAFMPLYQAAQARARGGEPPCALELYTRVHAEMAYRQGADGNKINFHLVLAEHGYTHQAWLACDGYWTPRVASNVDPRFDISAATQFRYLMQQECDRIFGVAR